MTWGCPVTPHPTIVGSAPTGFDVPLTRADSVMEQAEDRTAIVAAATRTSFIVTSRKSFSPPVPRPWHYARLRNWLHRRRAGLRTRSHQAPAEQGPEQHQDGDRQNVPERHVDQVERRAPGLQEG